jgi:ribosomal protein L11 methyltransferase
LDWLEISIETTPEGLEAVCARLTALGYASFEIVDEQDFEAFLENNKRYWDYVDEELRLKIRDKSLVKLYLPDDASAPEQLTILREGMECLREDCPELDLGSLGVSAGHRNEEEWAEAWKRYYKPALIGKRLFLRPEWVDEPCPSGRVEYVSNPGMAFGTGTHASTRLCLLFLEKLIAGGERMLDLGCGSGILSVCGLLLGAIGAVGVDIDANAADVSCRSAELNHVGDRFAAYCGDVLTDAALLDKINGEYDVIAANIVADVIIALGGIAKRLLKPGGRLIVSGIIAERGAEVEEALRAQGLYVHEKAEQEGWCAMVLSSCKGGAI